MPNGRLWERAQSVPLEVAENILPGFNISFDTKVPKEMQHELRSFVRYMESHYRIPITLWVDFEYRHYLVNRDGKRVGYQFYWADFVSYPVFKNLDDIPMIRLPVRTEHSALESILFSFLQAITDYYAWLCGVKPEDVNDLDEKDAEAVLETYLNACDAGEWHFIGC